MKGHTMSTVLIFLCGRTVGQFLCKSTNFSFALLHIFKMFCNSMMSPLKLESIFES